MSKEGKYRVIIDTNLWLSFLIGKRLHDMLDIVSRKEVQLVMSPSLLAEILEVASRPKFTRYFRPDAVLLLRNFFLTYAEFYDLEVVPKRCRDPKDDYLLELSIVSSADKLVSGDKDLTDMKSIGCTRIIGFHEFRELFEPQD